MFRWAPFVFVRITLFFLTGILVGIEFPSATAAGVGVAVVAAGAVFYLFLFFVRRRMDVRSLAGATALSTIAVLGYVHVQWRTEISRENHVATVMDSVEHYEVIVSRFFQNRETSWRTEAHIRRVFYRGQWEERSGTMLLYLSKGAFAAPFRYGDRLLIKSHPVDIPPPQNRGEFDYKRFLSLKNIYGQQFLFDTTEVQFLGHQPASLVLDYAFAARGWAERQIAAFVSGNRERAIASALVLGVTDGLDDELLGAYAATGSMHVLAVSGLHVGIIYLLLASLLKPLGKVRGGPWLIAGCGLAVLWSYAFITGLSPSVFRAVVMFSFVALAKPIGRSTNIYNTLGASAFLILLIDPFLVMSVGFQLSYLAVLGIVYFQPMLYPLWAPRQRALDEVWKITSVSIAAQLSTFSLGLLYFHQFPNYFILSNLFVIPAGFAVLVLGLVLLAVSPIAFLAKAVGFLLTWCIKILNYLIFATEQLPFSLTEGLMITPVQALLLALLILCGTLLIRKKRFSYVILLLVFGVAFGMEQWRWHRSLFSSERLTVYSIRSHTAIELAEKGNSWFAADSLLALDSGKIKFHILPNRLITGISRVSKIESYALFEPVSDGAIMSIDGRLVAWMQSPEFRLPSGIHPDFLIVSNNSLRLSSEHPLPFSGKVILDGSNSYFYSKRLKALAGKSGADVHAVLLDGAFEQLF